MKVQLIGVHYKSNKSKTPIGIRILDVKEKKTMDVPVANAIHVMGTGQAEIVGLEVINGELSGTNGVLDRYPKLVNNQIIDNNNIIIANQIGDEGYTISDWQGNIKVYRNNDVITLAKSNNMGIANGKLIEKSDGTTYISAINGSYELQNLPKKREKTKNTVHLEIKPEDKREFRKETSNKMLDEKLQVMKEIQDIKDSLNDPTDVEELKKELERRVKQQEQVQQQKAQQAQLKPNSIVAPKIQGSPLARELSRLKQVADESGMTVEQKMARALQTIRAISPFNYAMLQSISKIETLEVPIMGVSVDTLYYNPEFIKTALVSEIVFILIHEIYHIAMRHRQRHENRQHMLWNIACDLYINKLICNEFGVVPNTQGNTITIAGREHNIKFYDDGQYSDMVSVEKDTPERIYLELLEEQQNQQDQGQGGGGEDQGDSGEGQGSGGSGQGDDQQDQQDQDQNGEGGDQGDQDGDQQGDQDGQGQSGGGQGNQEDGQGEGEYGQGEGDQKDKEGNEGKEGEGQGKEGEGQGKDGEGQGKENDITFRGQKLGKLKVVDIVDDSNSEKMSDTQKEARTKSLLGRAMVVQKQNTGEFGGEAGGWLERYVEEVMAPKINWRSLLQNKLTLANQTVSTFSAPDRRFLSRGRILPGPKKLDNNELENVKVAIDTSGSISDQDLGIAMAQIKQLLQKFNAKAELMYWDTDVRVCEPFNNVQELLKIMPGGGGGTDVNCVFEQFEGRDYKLGKKQPPSIIIIFTDGYFGAVESKYKKYKDTIWVIHDNPGFKPPFGKMAPFRYDIK